jgi:hypothetical protein
MSDIELTNPYDPDAFERRPSHHAAPRSIPPPAAPAGLPTPPPPEAAPPAEMAGAGPVPWKAAASSVPRLRQQPVSQEPAPAEGSFQGFAQDEIPARGSAMIGEPAGRLVEAAPDDELGVRSGALALEPPVWEVWLERLRALPAPLVLGGCAALLLAGVLAFVLRPAEQGGVSLSRIRQHPEAFDGRQVVVRGEAGETFSIGGSYVFNLRQGRDTIVVYSRTRRPSLRENVRATGTVSVGYLDGVPRVALFEESPTP